MPKGLQVLRSRDESSRFDRLRRDDSRTAISAQAALSLESALRREIDGEVRFDTATRALYATDGSNYRQAPIGVVIPRHVEDVEATLRLARQYGAPILSRGGGTSLAGQCCNVAVVMDFSKFMRQVVRIDADSRIGIVQPGCVLDHFRQTASEQAGLFFGPDPSTHSRCTIGGMLGNNSCGSHSLLSKKHGLGLRMSDNTHAMDVLLYDGTRMHVGPTPPDLIEAMIRAGGRQGEIYTGIKSIVEHYGEAIRNRFPKLQRRVSGYNLDDLLPENGCNIARALVGSESTLVTILQAELHLIPVPKARSIVMMGFDDLVTAAECGLEVLKFDPIACEGIDELLFEYVKQKGDESASLAILPKGPAYLLVEFGGESKADSDDQGRRMVDHVKQLGNRAPIDMKLYDDPEQEKMLWDVREGALASTAWVPEHPDSWPGFEDSAVPVEAVPAYLRELRDLFHKYGYNPSLYGHIGQGCVHCRVGFDFYNAGGIDDFKRFMADAVALVTRHGGVASGEHGDGQARGQFLEQMFGAEVYQAFKEFKRLWDPDNRMNPGKVIDPDGPPYGITDNLRIGADYNPPQPTTYFQFPQDRHSFARAALRCVGVGVCRREEGGTMCPSYMVTRDERDSTRGRARMLFEMMNGEIITDGWKSEEVKESLDVCFSCKGCKGDCPVSVDMTTYKGEFLSHYYRGRLRPRHAYAFGWIHLWATAASIAPSVANLFTQLPGLRSLSKWIAGVHPNRKIPPFAPRSFKQWFAARAAVNPGGPPVVLFADTFNNHFHPDVAIAAVEVLEDAGFCVQVPMQNMCCGRPLYDYGFLGMARRWWIDNLEKLRPYYTAGTAVVVLEPSCWASFHDELINLLPNNEDAKRLKMLTFTLSDFLRRKAPDYRIPRFERKALLHGHCHQKALDKLNDKEFGELFAEKEILCRMGIDYDAPATGCCGMAGAFGYEKEHDHYSVGVAAGERVLLPAVRDADKESLILADGFSCQEQVEQQTGRGAMHLAMVLRMAMDGPEGAPSGHPESRMMRSRQRAVRRGMIGAGFALVGGIVAGALAIRWAQRHRRETNSQRS